MLCCATEQGALSGPLTQACVERYESSKDAQFLLPAIPGMQRAAVLQIFPKLLDLPPGQFKAALHRLMMPLAPSGKESSGVWHLLSSVLVYAQSRTPLRYIL